MKNKSLWLALAIFAGVVFLLTWIIPSTNYNDTGSLVLGAIKPMGLWDLFYSIPMLILWFGPNIIFIIAMGAFYGVVNKTGSLRALQGKIVPIFKNREKIFLMATASFFLLLASLTGITFPLIFFIPLFAGVILTLGFNKMDVLVSTIGAVLIGVMGSIYASDLFAPIAQYVKSGITFGWYKFALIILGLVIINGYLHLTAKISKKDDIDEAKFFIEKKEGPKSPKIWPLITAFGLLLVLFVLGLTSWTGMLNFNGFATFHTKLLDIKIGSFVVLKSLLGSTAMGTTSGSLAFGSWDILTITSLLIVFMLGLILVYKVKWEEAYKGIIKGVGQLLPTAIIVLFIYLIYIMMMQSGAQNTVIKAIAGLTNGINVFAYSFATFIGASVVDPSSVASNVAGVLSSVSGKADSIPLLLFILQAMYGLVMLIAPTSLILIAGLSYFEVSYTKWLKYVWRLLLVLLVVIIVILNLAVII